MKRPLGLSGFLLLIPILLILSGCSEEPQKQEESLSFQQSEVKESFLEQNMRTVQKAIERYGAEKGAYPRALDPDVKKCFRVPGGAPQGPVNPFSEKSEWPVFAGQQEFRDLQDGTLAMVPGTIMYIPDPTRNDYIIIAAGADGRPMMKHREIYVLKGNGEEGSLQQASP